MHGIDFLVVENHFMLILIVKICHYSTEQRKQKLSEVRAGLEDAESLVIN